MSVPTFLTAAPKVKKALLAMFEAQVPSGVAVTYAHPGGVIQQEAVYFGRVKSREVAGALGKRRRDEDFDLEIVVDVAQDGDDAQAAEERCWEIVAALELAVGNNAGTEGALGEAVDGWAVWSGAEMTPHILDGQRLAEAICTVWVKNRKRVTSS